MFQCYQYDHDKFKFLCTLFLLSRHLTRCLQHVSPRDMSQTEVITIIYQELLKVAGGATLLLAALSAFLGKVWIGRIANREAQMREAAIAELKAQFDKEAAELKSRLDVATQRTVLVDKVRFEHEYEIYKKAWELLFALQRATLQLRPTLDHIDLSESKEERMQRRIGNVIKPYDEFSLHIETAKPFYPEDVYSALTAVRNRCHDEIIDYEFVERPQKEYWEEARKSQEEIVALINQSCEAIRNRIAEVRVA